MWSAVSILKVKVVQLIPTELTYKVIIFGNAINDKKKRDGQVY